MTVFWKIADNIESYLCRLLLVGFVGLLFTQIVSREIFGTSISWIEELSVYMFVWFVFFGASHAAKMAAHNRVTFQFKMFPAKWLKYFEAFADLFWIFFNVYFIVLAIDFIFNKMNKFQSSQTLGFHLSYVYIALPIAFTLMTIRVLQVNYHRLVMGEEIEDPDKVDLEQLKHDLHLDEDEDKGARS